MKVYAFGLKADPFRLTLCAYPDNSVSVDLVNDQTDLALFFDSIEDVRAFVNGIHGEMSKLIAGGTVPVKAATEVPAKDFHGLEIIVDDMVKCVTPEGSGQKLEAGKTYRIEKLVYNPGETFLVLEGVCDLWAGSRFEYQFPF